ncbi:MAG: transporter substrate-binding domain-containing protein [Victivallales bacterium]|nr:transporter substrate-binding domain-containing protein [Victivallales bacterium]
MKYMLKAIVPFRLMLAMALSDMAFTVHAESAAPTSPPPTAAIPAFTEAEQQWLQQHPEINVGVSRHSMPYEGLTADDRYEGLISGYLDFILQKTGLKASYRSLSWTDQLSRLREGKVDLLPLVPYQPERQQNMLLSTPYFGEKLMVMGMNSSGIASFNDLNGKTIALQMNYGYEKVVRNDFPNAQIYLANNIDDAVAAVKQGKADVYIGLLSAICRMQRSRPHSELRMLFPTPYEIKFCFGIRKDQPELLHLINQIIPAIPAAQTQQFYRQWITDAPVKKDEKFDFSRLTRPYIIIHAAAFLLLIIFLLLLLRHQRRELRHRKSTENQMKDNLMILETIFDTIPGPVFYVGINGEFIDCNRAFADEIIGMPKGKMIDRQLADIIALQNADKITFFQHKTSELIQAGGIQIYDMDFVCADGSPRDFSVYSAAFKRSDKEAGIINIMLDISEKKKIEKELMLAKNMAEAATDAKSNFVANMSHELRTPLNAVIGITHLIMQTELTNKQLGYLHKIDTASRHLLGVINDVLDFSKIEAGKMSMEQIDFSLNTIFRELKDMFSAKAREKNLNLTFTINPSVPGSLRGDPLRLKQILINLVSNAVKFTDSGEVGVVAEFSRKRGNRVRIKFSVVDTGIGMDREQLDNLFIPFTQADNSMTRKFGGTGLGLVITKRLIELMDGKLEVTSAPNTGSNFTFDAEFEVGKLTEEVTDTSTIIAINRMAMKSKNLDKIEKIRGARVLLVEDNAINRQVAREMLTQVGIVVDSAENGQEAVAAVVDAGKEFDAIFMDVQMPIMDGYKATEAIRNAGKTVPIIALTAHVMPTAIKRCLQSGMNDHLNKPLNPELMYTTLLKWIKPGERQYSPPPPPPQTTAEPLCDMPGLNLSKALEPINNDQALMRQLLDTFRKDFGHEGDNIIRALEQQDTNYLRHSFHKLKGSASYIGADKIRGSAAELELKIINHQPITRSDAEVLVNSIAEVVDSIAILSGKPTVAH